MTAMLLEEICSVFSQGPDLFVKAKSLGIHPEGMERAEIIRAIQRAEGNTPCFGASNGKCVHTACYFRAECMGRGRQDYVDLPKQELKLSQKVPLSVKVEEQWIDKGILILPRRFQSFLTATNTIHVVYDDIDELLPYDENTATIEGVAGFYQGKAIIPGDRVHIQLRAIDPTYLLLDRSW
jgi:hypothetical protein